MKPALAYFVFRISFFEFGSQPWVRKVRPTGFRTGIMRPWRSTWYAAKADFSELLVEDFKVRAFIHKYLTNKKDRKEQRPAISDIRIERTRERVTVVITSSRVGAIIGKKGEKIDKLNQGARETDPPAH